MLIRVIRARLLNILSTFARKIKNAKEILIHQVVFMADTPIIEETIKLIKEGQKVTLRANGHSMLPFIVEGKDDVLLVQPTTPRIGDVVLAHINGNRYVIHRIIAINGDNITLMGDGNLAEQEHCLRNDIAARVDYFINSKGERHYLYTPFRIIMARIWFWLLPFRRYLLAIYRRL